MLLQQDHEASLQVQHVVGCKLQLLFWELGSTEDKFLHDLDNNRIKVQFMPFPVQDPAKRSVSS